MLKPHTINIPDLVSCPRQARTFFAIFFLLHRFASPFRSALVFPLAQRVFLMLFWLPSPVSPGSEDTASRSRRWGTIPRRCILLTRNTPTCPAVVPLCGTKVEVTVPSLDDWEKEWQENSQRSVQPKLLPVDFRSALPIIVQSN